MRLTDGVRVGERLRVLRGVGETVGDKLPEREIFGEGLMDTEAVVFNVGVRLTLSVPLGDAVPLYDNVLEGVGGLTERLDVGLWLNVWVGLWEQVWEKLNVAVGDPLLVSEDGGVNVVDGVAEKLVVQEREVMAGHFYQIGEKLHCEP